MQYLNGRIARTLTTCVNLVTHSAMYAATDSGLSKLRYMVNLLGHTELENYLYFNFRCHLKCQIQGQRTAYRISFRNYDSTRNNMISDDDSHPGQFTHHDI